MVTTCTLPSNRPQLKVNRELTLTSLSINGVLEYFSIYLAQIHISEFFVDFWTILPDVEFYNSRITRIDSVVDVHIQKFFGLISLKIATIRLFFYLSV